MSEPASRARSLEPDLSRIVSRISSTYFMRTLRLIADFHDGEVITALIFQAIVTANTAHLDQADEGQRYAGIDSPPPDDLRRPVSILALSQGLGLPFETTRRHVNRMLASGRCVRVKNGIIVPQAAIEDDVVQAMRRANLANIRKLVRDLRRIGLDPDQGA